jgi:NADH-quinone oxidoreductase subunit N
MKGLFIIIGLGILAMLAEIFKFKRMLYPMVLVGIVAAFIANLSEWNYEGNAYHLFTNMIRFDNAALGFSGVILTIAFCWFIFANDYFTVETSISDHFSLVLFTLSGALILTAYQNMATLFLGIEIMSIPLYVLAASRKNDAASNEAGFKYLIMGSFATGFLLFGIALVYGATGSFDLMQIHDKVGLLHESLPMFFYAGVLMLLVAMSFKVSAAPFHFWAPDVYQGSPTVITAFMSTIVKTAAFAAFMRLFLIGFGSIYSNWAITLSVIVALTLVISNITAATQASVKRMLAYSSISHAGFMLMAILSNNPERSLSAILYYMLAYSIGSITAFSILYSVTKDAEGNEGVSIFNGLGKRNPLMAVCMVIAMLSLAGIPVTAGFFAKYYIFTVMMGGTFKWLLILAILTSAVGVYYYFKVILAMYSKTATNEGPVLFEKSTAILVILTTIITILLGVVPGYVIDIFR